MIKDLHIEGSSQTPKINFNAKTGALVISGRSLPEDASKFYKVIFDWLNNYFKNLAVSTEIKFELDYFNTASAKAIFSAIVKFDELYKKDYPISIKWFYDEDDEDMKDLGEEYQDLFTIPINLIKKLDE